MVLCEYEWLAIVGGVDPGVGAVSVPSLHELDGDFVVGGFAKVEGVPGIFGESLRCSVDVEADILKVT